MTFEDRPTRLLHREGQERLRVGLCYEEEPGRRPAANLCDQGRSPADRGQCREAAGAAAAVAITFVAGCKRGSARSTLLNSAAAGMTDFLAKAALTSRRLFRRSHA